MMMIFIFLIIHSSYVLFFSKAYFTIDIVLKTRGKLQNAKKYCANWWENL